MILRLSGAMSSADDDNDDDGGGAGCWGEEASMVSWSSEGRLLLPNNDSF